MTDKHLSQPYELEDLAASIKDVRERASSMNEEMLTYLLEMALEEVRLRLEAQTERN
ncbi:hypothetical protein [uncultured Hoeflea sp.]|uniref:hypothetical protein n=1 Tax=uncultured Hoeflea sp. TaxID=538666 RepID=UPI002619C881|nr:hypothetical protein [uncultured Hoeflea sp.]